MPAGTITSISGQERSPWLRMHSDADQVSDVIPGSQTFGQNQPVAVTPSSLDVRASAEVNEEGGTEYAIDAAGDQLVHGRSTLGQYEVVGPLDIDVPAGPVGLEILDGEGYLATGGNLYRVDLATGATTVVGSIGAGRSMRDLALVAPPRVVYADQTGGVPIQGAQEGVESSVRLSRVGDPHPPVELTLRYVTDEATAGEDFDGALRQVSFAARQREIRVPVPVVDDDVVEPMEEIGIEVDGERRGWALWLFDDDSEFDATVLSVSEAAGVATVALKREDARMGTSVQLSTGGGTATAGEDFKPVRTSVNFAPGQAGARVTVPLVDDAAVEGAETVSLRLASPTVTRFANPRRAATLTITSDDTDRVAPAVHVLSRWLRLRRPVRVPLSCSEACRATVELRVTRRQAKRLKVPVRVARATVRTAKAGRATARLVVARRTLARLRRARRVPMTVRIAATDGAGNRRVAARRVVARR